MDMGFQNVACLKGGLNEWVDAQYPVEKKWTIRKECVTCHTNVTPGIVTEWRLSRHSQRDVSCSVCHGEHHVSHEDAENVRPVNPERCGMCHQVRWQQFKAGKHALAWTAMKAMPTAHWQPMVAMEGMKGCGGCHKLGLKTEGELRDLKDHGVGFGLASCDACHTRHSFSAKEARQPQACQTCHMGFDHPQWEMYSSSKHGVRYLLKQNGTLPEDIAAPTCQTCHMQEANHEVRTAWGFFGLVGSMPEDDKKWASSRKTILQALGALDPEGRPGVRLDVLRGIDAVRMDHEGWQKEREKGVKTCGQCHSLHFAKGELKKGDDMIREADMVMAEAIRLVAGLYKDGILRRPKSYLYPFPDLMAMHDAPTPIEQRLFLMFSEHRMRAFQGAFHANPDYSFWYGYSKMKQGLTEIKAMAEDLRRKGRPEKPRPPSP